MEGSAVDGIGGGAFLWFFLVAVDKKEQGEGMCHGFVAAHHDTFFHSFSFVKNRPIATLKPLPPTPMFHDDDDDDDKKAKPDPVEGPSGGSYEHPDLEIPGEEQGPGNAQQ